MAARAACRDAHSVRRCPRTEDSVLVHRSRGRRRALGRIGGRRAVAAVIAPLIIGLSLSFAPAATTSAAPGIQVNVDPEVENAAAGETVTLTADVRDQDGNPVGSGSH